MTQEHPRADCWYHNGDKQAIKPIWYEHPERTSFELWEFKHQCSNMRRYNGGLDWTLLKHLALGVELCKVHFGTDHIAKIIAGYHAAHDLHETIVGDMVSGMKKYVPNYQRLEAMWEEHIHEQIGLPLEASISKKAVHELDMMALVMEMHCLEHPVAYEAIQGVGIEPTPEWESVFWAVNYMTDEEAWAVVEEAVTVARQELGWQKSQ